MTLADDSQAEAQRQLQAADSARSGISTEPLVRCGMTARRSAVANVQIGGYRTSHVGRVVTVGNEAPVPGLASKVPRVSPGYSRMALADGQRRYDDAIGDFPV